VVLIAVLCPAPTYYCFPAILIISGLLVASKKMGPCHDFRPFAISGNILSARKTLYLLTLTTVTQLQAGEELRLAMQSCNPQNTAEPLKLF
jgi:hypothetical protein